MRTSKAYFDLFLWNCDSGLRSPQPGQCFRSPPLSSDMLSSLRTVAAGNRDVCVVAELVMIERACQMG